MVLERDQWRHLHSNFHLSESPASFSQQQQQQSENILQSFACQGREFCPLWKESKRLNQREPCSTTSSIRPLLMDAMGGKIRDTFTEDHNTSELIESDSVTQNRQLGSNLSRERATPRTSTNACACEPVMVSAPLPDRPEASVSEYPFPNETGRVP